MMPSLKPSRLVMTHLVRADKSSYYRRNQKSSSGVVITNVHAVNHQRESSILRVVSTLYVGFVHPGCEPFISDT